MNITMKTAACAVALGALAAPVLAQTATTANTVVVETQETGSTIGYLECTVEGGFGLLVASSKDAVCTFDQAEGDTQTYVATIDKLGIDIGVSGESYLKWGVVQLLDHAPEEMTLDGTYVGVSADASVGVGIGANALIGGSNDSVALQPFSVEGKTGLNIALGLTSMTLTAVN